MVTKTRNDLVKKKKGYDINKNEGILDLMYYFLFGDYEENIQEQLIKELGKIPAMFHILNIHSELMTCIFKHDKTFKDYEKKQFMRKSVMVYVLKDI